MKSPYCLVAALLLAVIVATACGPTGTGGAPAQTGDQQASWQAQWDQLVKDAKAEGKIQMLTSAPGDVQTGLNAAFKEKFGVNIDFITGRGAELVPKLEAERRAGLYQTDVILIGWVTYLSMIRPMDAVDPIEPLLFRPDVKDTSKWLGGKLPILDKSGMAMAINTAALPEQIMNKDMVKQGEIAGVRDLIDPKWKAKIVMINPAIPGPSSYWYQLVINNIVGPEKGRDFMKALAGNVDAATADYRQATEWVARGKYAFAIGVRNEEPLSFIQAGAPIQFVDNKEPRVVQPGFGLLNIAKNRPHPNATKLFLNWLLTQEGMQLFTKLTQQSTPRIDASTEGLLQVLLPRPNDVLPSEANDNQLPQMMTWAKEDFGRLLQ